MMAALQLLILFYFLTYIGKNALGSDIINGQISPEGSRPYMVSVQSGGRHVCGGFLISEDFVVTAAHCDNSNPTSVVLGTHNLKTVNKNTVRRSVTRCKHPNYRNAGNGDDIMLLKLHGKVRLNGRIKAIQLPKAVMDLKENTTCKVAGWGLTQPGGTVVDKLHEVNVPVVSITKCMNAWQGHGLWLPNNVICAGGFQTNNGFCRGDSGGPLVYARRAFGVASFNYRHNCDYPNVPNVYTDVSKYLPWIYRILKTKRC